jgi:CDP-diacylglycerol--serine O-phosphatidyltransferase
MAVVRLGLYTAYDLGDAHTEGVQTTLAATLLATIHLAGVADLLGVNEAALLLGFAALSVYLMVAPVTYPELFARDALLLGGLQALALLFPTFVGRVFPRGLLLFALAYLLLAPRFYWRSTRS